MTRSPCLSQPPCGPEATLRDTECTKQQEGEERHEKVRLEGREGRLRQELQLHTTKKKSLNRLYSAPSPACYVISLQRLMADREIPVFSIISAGHASMKRAHLSRVFLAKNFPSRCRRRSFLAGENSNLRRTLFYRD